MRSMKNLFSVRNGYESPYDVIITERLTPEMINCICTCYDNLEENINKHGTYADSYKYVFLERYLWVYFLHNRESDFTHGYGYRIVATRYIKGEDHPWYKKFDLIETTIEFLARISKDDSVYLNILDRFVEQLNFFFEDLNYGYRVIDHKIVPVSSKIEKDAIEEGIKDAEANVKEHLSIALGKLSERPQGDYRNSIKESISAVEAYCRNLTGNDTLGSALAELEHNGVHLHPSLKSAFNILYGYTNSEETGIRHPLMDQSGDYIPTADEAIYMLVVCCSFINFLRKKQAKLNK